VLEASERPPVVVVVSDHGSGSGLFWGDLDNSDLDERTANLIAAYTPGAENPVTDAGSLVNVLGQVVNAYLGTAYPLQPDHIFVPDPWFPAFRELPNPDTTGDARR
jgi:hypothetical protein